MDGPCRIYRFYMVITIDGIPESGSISSIEKVDILKGCTHCATKAFDGMCFN